jgi:FtsZ-binding cell division protein ZapB
MSKPIKPIEKMLKTELIEALQDALAALEAEREQFARERAAYEERVRALEGELDSARKARFRIWAR